MCFPLDFETIDPPTEKSKSLVNILKILMYTQILLGFIKLTIGIISGLGELGSLGELISACVLYLAYVQLNPCSCILYMFFTLLNAVFYFAIIGKLLQNQEFIQEENNSLKNLAIVIFTISFIFSIVACYFVYQAYKEFKNINSMEFWPQGNNNQADNRNYGAIPRNNPTGYRPVDTYQAQPIREPARSNSTFTGTGVMIGGN